MAPVDNGATALGSVHSDIDDSGARVVRLVGEIDISNADALGRHLDRLLAVSGGPVVIDLAGLDFMDSSGIAMLLRAVGDAATVEIRNPSTVVRRIIECTGLAEILRIS